MAVVLPYAQTHPINRTSSIVVKLFLEDEAAAVFCFAQVIDSEPFEEGFKTRFVFSHIREEDQELMVRASLHAQAKVLKKKQSTKNIN